MTNNVLRLTPLKETWYRMIESGVKTEEYREIKKFYDVRILDKDGNIKHYDLVTLYNGYKKNRPSMIFKVKEIVIAEGRPEWGAEKGQKYYVIRLGDRIK